VDVSWLTSINSTYSSASITVLIQAALCWDYSQPILRPRILKHPIHSELNCAHNRNNQHNAQIFTTALFIYAGSCMFPQKSAIFRGLLDRSELHENTDRYGGLSYNVVKWPVSRSVVVHIINWLVFITETECVYWAVRTGSLYTSIILRSAHTVYLCVLCGSENKQRLFPYTALTVWFL
jgi:hypothetical protein